MSINVFWAITCNMVLSIRRSKYFNIIHSESFSILYITYLWLEQLHFYIRMHPKLDKATIYFELTTVNGWLVSFHCFSVCYRMKKTFRISEDGLRIPY